VNGPDVCGRPTKTKPHRACSRPRASVFVTALEIVRFDACGNHLDADERRRWDALRQADEVRNAEGFKAWMDAEPACWSWTTAEPPVDGDLSEDLDVGARARILAGRTFGVARIRRWQDGRCALCGHHESPRELVVDHDHVTALVRGLLCRGCNVQEGHYTGEHGATVYTRYREKNPATILGIEERYVHPLFGEAKPQPDIPWSGDTDILASVLRSPSRCSAR